jgi:hypothetical protein
MFLKPVFHFENFRNALLASAIGLLLSSCSAGYHRYDSTVTSEQRDLIETDHSRFADSQMVSRSAEDLKTLAIGDLSGPSLIHWLAQRNRIVVGENYDWSGENFVASQQVNEPPKLLTSAQIDLSDGVSAASPITVMVNLGASIYLSGVSRNTIYTVRAADQDVRIWSPRAAGIIQVGEGLFQPMHTGGSIDSYAHSVRRFSTYIHEATHTDGNGEHRAFAHATCPASFARPEFRGEYACENYLNGPYSRQVVFLRYAIAQLCPQNGCSSAEQDALLKTLADYDSRKLPSAVYVDPTPEGYGVGSTREFSAVPQLSEVGVR